MEGVFAQIFYLSGAHDPLTQFFAVWKNCSFTECVPQKTTSACVDSNPRGHRAYSIVSGGTGQPPVSSCPKTSVSNKSYGKRG